MIGALGVTVLLLVATIVVMVRKNSQKIFNKQSLFKSPLSEHRHMMREMTNSTKLYEEASTVHLLTYIIDIYTRNVMMMKFQLSASCRLPDGQLSPPPQSDLSGAQRCGQHRGRRLPFHSALSAVESQPRLSSTKQFLRSFV